MRIVLDCDGVLGLFVKPLWDELGKDFSEVDDWDIWKYMSPVEKKLAQHITADHRWWRGLPVKDGALEGVFRLKEAGHDIHVVTSPFLSCLGWSDARRWWLKKHFAFDHKHVHISAAKFMYDADVFVDDKPEHVTAWLSERHRGKMHVESREPVSLLMDSHHNKDFEWPCRFTWDELTTPAYSELLEAA